MVIIRAQTADPTAPHLLLTRAIEEDRFGWSGEDHDAEQVGGDQKVLLNWMPSGAIGQAGRGFEEVNDTRLAVEHQGPLPISGSQEFEQRRIADYDDATGIGRRLGDGHTISLQG